MHGEQQHEKLRAVALRMAFSSIVYGIGLQRPHNGENNSFPFSGGITVAKRKLKVTQERLLPPFLSGGRRVCRAYLSSRYRYPAISSVSPLHRYRSDNPVFSRARAGAFSPVTLKIARRGARRRGDVGDARVGRRSSDGGDNS